MKDAAKISLIVLLLLGSVGAATRKKSKVGATSNEPFTAFAMFDLQLASLGREQQALKLVLAPTTASLATSTKPKEGLFPWVMPARQVERRAQAIRVLAERLQRRYRARREPFGARVFQSLSDKASSVERTAKALARSREHKSATRIWRDLEEQSLLLVLQYQGVSGGYGALRCTSKVQQSCCQPKPNSLGQENVIACQWRCVSSAQACHNGFCGPQIRKP